MATAERITCPHCAVAFADEPVYQNLGTGPEGQLVTALFICLACKNRILYLLEGAVGFYPGGSVATVSERTRRLIHPRTGGRTVPVEVPAEFASLYRKASAILDDAPEASAAMSRRCLQEVLQGPGGATPSNLSDQIDLVVSGGVPTWVSEPLHALREIGNFGTHPIKSTNTGVVMEVQPGEAEWSLDTLDAVFDHYFVQPAKEAERKEAINAKLGEAGRKPV